MLAIIVTLMVNLLVETSASFSVVVPRDQIVAHVGSSVTLPCWISPPENAEALEIRWYRQDQFRNPVLFYQHGKIQDVQEESYRNRSSLTLRSDQSGGLKDGDVSLRLEKVTVQDDGSFHCYMSGDDIYGSGEVVLKVIDPSDSSGPWKALFFTLLICALLGLVGLILYKYRHKLTGKKPEDQIVGEINIEELRKYADQITIDQHYVSPDLTVFKDRTMMRDSINYNHTGEGFPHKLYALGAQKFTSGRHYWVVALAVPPKPPNNFWLIGVAKEESFRSKNKSFTPSNGFWFLCSDGPNGFFINSDPPVQLSPTPRPEQLGVLLDYDGGQLSFYSVKERKHLLTMSTRFSGSVVPLFNPGVGDQSPLKILDCPKPVESPVESSQPLLSDTESIPDASDTTKRSHSSRSVGLKRTLVRSLSECGSCVNAAIRTRDR